MEDVDYLRRFQRHSHDSGGMLCRSSLERRDPTGERRQAGKSFKTNYLQSLLDHVVAVSLLN